MEIYDHKKIEKKWQEKWQKDRVYKTIESASENKCYVLDMFPYPSGDGLHVGHPKGYIATDVYSRYKKMNGFNVLHPMGWDAFGLPAENYAIKNKIHPKIAVLKNIEKFKSQLMQIGFNYDWDREINTTHPEYYKWTQWIFLKLFEKGLAYESYEPINWCPSCQTGLANEDLEDGKCERCGSVVERRPMRQWILRITDYAEKLLNDLEQLDWPESIKESQRNWIGRSEGMLFRSPVKDTDLVIETYSAHFEAFMADTFLVIAPDHPLLPKLLKGLPNEKELLSYAYELANKRLRDKSFNEKNIEGMFTGRYTIDPVGNGELPIWIASYALADYGTGIVKCSSHDKRDFVFAKKYGIKLKPVMFPADSTLRKKVEKLEVCFDDMSEGILNEPDVFSGKKAREIREDIIKYLEHNKLASKKITYKMRDWVFSRQRYWGEPIPIVHCEKCGVVPVPEEDLPVKLPDVEHYEPTGTGESPLSKISDWVNTTCPKCGGKAKRETNTMPQWAGSCWYHIGYAINKDGKFNLKEDAAKNYWLPVDMYVGGAEHATRHLIYARFWHKFLFDIGVIEKPEPFLRLQNVGLILAEDGKKMSKRYGNVVNPDDIIEKFGADSFRIYEMFMGPFNANIAWSTDNLVGSRRFVERVWKLADKLGDVSHDSVTRALHNTIDKVTRDINNLSFNTAISSMMIFLNTCDDHKISKKDFGIFLKLLSPFAPHVAEELWTLTGNTGYIYQSSWSVADASMLETDVVNISVQVDGKPRLTIEVKKDTPKDELINMAKNNDKVAKWISRKAIKKIVYISNKVINFVTS